MKAGKVLILGVLAAGIAVWGAQLWSNGREEERIEDAVFRKGVFEIPFISTRGHVDNGVLLPGYNPYGYEVFGKVPGLTPGCPSAKDIVVVAHGLNNDTTKAINRFCLARESLRRNGYRGEVVGFSWDGSTNWDPWGATGYKVAKHNAVANGTKLARLVCDLSRHNPGARIRLIGYSMGARLVAEGVLALDRDRDPRSRRVKVASIHLVGAAIDNEQCEVGDLYGDAIESRVGRFYNYFSPLDSKLGRYYGPLEADSAIGRVDIEHPERAPSNYLSRNVAAELKAVDESGGLDKEGEAGTNHSACLGIRDNAGRWVDDGIMNVVADDIASEGGS